MLKKTLLLAWLLVPSLALAQLQLSGTIRDAETGEPLAGANLVVENTFIVRVAQTDGTYTLALPAGVHTLRVSYIGYETWTQTINVNRDQTLDVALQPTAYLSEAVIVSATRATAKTPTTFTNVDQRDIQARNLGQDVPILLNFTPSLVTTSDAGAGVGYTGLRIRGNDATRINVTINGIPLNDAESQGVFWVDLPDFLSSTESIQIQRGVGTSTNGAGAFGATINLQTSALNAAPYGQLDNTIGSFNTRKHTLQLGSGLLNGLWAFEGRLSLIQSDGYIDRATSDLRSYFLSAGYYGQKTVLRAMAFSGHEVTYQSWFGTPESRLTGDEAAMQTHAANNGYTPAQLQNLLASGRTYNFYLYENEVDDYQQDHYQLHLSHQFDSPWLFTGALHWTKGQGFFEQFREEDDFIDYGLAPLVIGNTTILSGDFIRRRWLDNDFYGLTANVHYPQPKFDVTFGGAVNRYDGDHFGEIIWAEFGQNLNLRDRYYQSVGLKTDANLFGKATYQITPKLSLFGDLQVRMVNYETTGQDNDLRPIDVNTDFTFFNPKLGATFTPSSGHTFYASFSVGNREPTRGDFVDAPALIPPKHETLYDTELGWKYNTNNYFLEANAYYMVYDNQLVLTGELNDVGAPIRTNVPDSYRLGLELQWGWSPLQRLTWQGNLTLSRNRIQDFTEIVYDYTNGFDVRMNTFADTDISFSPSVIAGSQLRFQATEKFELAFLSKYVGAQFLDNTANANRQIDAYFVNDVQATLRLAGTRLKNFQATLLINNVFNHLYASNGYTFSYIFGDLITENFYYPQAGRHVLFGVSLGF